MIRYLIILFIFLNSICQLSAFEKPEYDLYTHINIKPGIYFDDLSEINNVLTQNGFPELNSENVKYIGINYASNHFPFRFYQIPNIFISFDIRFPLERSVQTEKSVSLKTYSVFLELEGFHDLINNITVYPILGFGASWTKLNLLSDSSVIFKNLLNTKGNAEISKFNLLLNLGGGIDYKIKLSEDYLEKINLILGLNVRYSLNLDIFGLYDKRWYSAGKYIDDLPEYHAPGLSIELKAGLEIMQKLKKVN